MSTLIVSSSLSQANSPFVLGSERTPISTRVKTPIRVEPCHAYPKRERTPKVEESTRPKPKLHQLSSTSYVRRETNEFVEHVYEGTNIRHFYCKFAGCSHSIRPLPSKVRVEKHLDKCHAINLKMPDCRKMKKNIKHSKMPGRLDEFLKYNASAMAFEGNLIGSKRKGSRELPIDLCTPTPKKGPHVEEEVIGAKGMKGMNIVAVGGDVCLEGKEIELDNQITGEKALDIEKGDDQSIVERTIAVTMETHNDSVEEAEKSGPQERRARRVKCCAMHASPRRSKRLLAKSNMASMC